MSTLFEKVGGHQNLTKIVAQFYQHILADDRINSFFLENVSDIVKLHTTMELFLSELFDGPKGYTGPDMVTLHKNMKIKKQHFNNTWEHMEAAFLYYGTPKTLIPQIREKIYSQFGSIVNTPELLDQTNENDLLIPQQEEQHKEEVQKKPQIQQPNGEEENGENNTSQNPHETKLQIIRTIEVSQTKILDMNKNASKKKQKNEKKQFKHIESKSSALFLRYNKITSIEGLYGIVEKVFPNLNNLIWIDLSFNRLVQLVGDFAQFPNLKNLYLHSNYIYEFKELQKLSQAKLLRSLTIHANPLQKYEEFRVLIAHILPQLQKIDSTLLTKRQKERGEVLKHQMKKYPVIKNPQPRPEESDNEEQG